MKAPSQACLIKMRAAFALLTLALSACGGPAAEEEAPAEQGPAVFQPEFGSNDVFREMTAAAEGHELIVADLLLPPDAVGPAHYHPWEEYLYVIGGSAVLDIDGREAQQLTAGEAFIIPRETAHTPRAGPEGIRAIVVRVHDEGDPVRVLVEEEAAE